MTGPRRRTVLAGLAGGLGALVLPARLSALTGPGAAVLSETGLGPYTAYALCDLNGDILDAHSKDEALPPASVIKAVTALYALDRLGADFRFVTELRATGPIKDGVLDGDLVLAGGGDPLLDTDALGDLVAVLAEDGLREITGRLIIADGALPTIRAIEAEQPMHVGYNPAISGLNLNFNRVHLAWKPGANGPVFTFSAEGQRHSVAVRSITGASGSGPLPAMSEEDGIEVWSLPGSFFGGRGGVWMPVRAPARYAAEVFWLLAERAGLTLPEPEIVETAPPGSVLARHESPPLETMMRDMLRYSTNLTAEIAGLQASREDDPAISTLTASAAAMQDWADKRWGLGAGVRFVDHSGLNDQGRVSPDAMLAVLRGGRDELPGLMRPLTLLNANRERVRMAGLAIPAKTGTLNFVSGLAGYVLADGQKPMGFAIFSADLDTRAEIPPEQRHNAPGARRWARRARNQQQALLRSWLAEHPPIPGVLRPRPRRASGGEGRGRS